MGSIFWLQPITTRDVAVFVMLLNVVRLSQPHAIAAARRRLRQLYHVVSTAASAPALALLSRASRLAIPWDVADSASMKTLARTADDLVGTYRTFGVEGPVYEVLRTVNETTVRIVVVATGEELNYSAEQALNDPEAE